jgi:hypothetical protein
MVDLYIDFEKSVDTPDKTSEDYLVRLRYVRKAIEKWEGEQGMEWKELFGTLTGTLTNGVCSDNTVALVDFKRPAGFLKIGTDKYEYVRPEQMEKEERENSTKKIYTITGSKGAYSVVVAPAVSGTFTLNYRKNATKFYTGSETTEIEMSDPTFILHDVLSQLYLDDDNTTQATVETQVASSKMDAMRLANETIPFYQNNNVPSDTVNFGE